MSAAAVGQAVPDAPPRKSVRPNNSNAVWAALFWKEWCEHRWKMLAMLVIGASILAPLWRSMSDIESLATGFIYLAVVAPLAALFAAMGAAAGEHASGTIDFVRRLPTERWRLAAVKLAMAYVTALVPAALILLVNPEMALVLPLGVASLVIWFAAFGMNRSDEVRAVAFGVFGVGAVWGVVVLVAGWVLSLSPAAFVMNYFYGVPAIALPGGAFFLALRGSIDGTTWLWYAVAYAASHVPLLWRWLAGYGTQSPRRSDLSLASPESEVWLAAPFASPMAAILWKQLRETLPVALAALALAAVWTGLALLTDGVGEGPLAKKLASGASLFGSLAGVCAFLAAVVAGVGLFLEDLRVGVHTFWRSRPIPPDLWFWSKYLGGAACLIGVFGTVFGAGHFAWSSAGSSLATVYAESGSGGYLHGVLGCWLVYAGAACAYCLVRQPIYAAILAVGLPAILYGFVGGGLSYLRFEFSTIQATLSVLFFVGVLAATLLAWQAVRRDWAVLR